MTETLKKIWNSKNGRFIVFLFCMTLTGVFLYFDRPSVTNQKDLIEINGTCRHISQVLVYTKIIKKTERDSSYHIYLDEYPCKFQVSYSSYNRKEFFELTKPGDKIRLHIARQDQNYLNRQIVKSGVSL